MHAEPPTLRDAQPDDLPRLLALEARFPGDRITSRQFLHHMRSHSARLRVADILDHPVSGYALVFLRRGSTLARLYSIAVDPAARGRGLGHVLLADAERAARAGGADRLRLEVRVENTAAIALYLARGYEEFARYIGYYDDGSDALRFERRLD
jgi:[ribosomal protein S18]-alanine N-acetyltransferase